jgi:hypothetical protein
MPMTRLLNLVTALSLLLCVAVASLWPYSYFAFDVVGYWPFPADRRAYGLLSHHGSFCFLAVGERSPGGHFAWRHDRTRQSNPRIGGVAGFVFSRRPGELLVGVPHWTLALLLALPPALRLRSHRRRPRTPGVCRSCGYDLRATPERCPECGLEA